MRQHQPRSPHLQAVQLGLHRADSTFRKQRSPRQQTTFLSNCVYSLAGRERGGHTDTEPILAQYRGQSRSPRSRQSSPLSANKQQSCRNHASAQQTSATFNRAKQSWKNNNKFVLLSDRNQQDDTPSLLINQTRKQSRQNHAIVPTDICYPNTKARPNWKTMRQRFSRTEINKMTLPHRHPICYPHTKAMQDRKLGQHLASDLRRRAV